MTKSAYLFRTQGKSRSWLHHDFVTLVPFPHYRPWPDPHLGSFVEHVLGRTHAPAAISYPCGILPVTTKRSAQSGCRNEKALAWHFSGSSESAPPITDTPPPKGTTSSGERGPRPRLRDPLPLIGNVGFDIQKALTALGLIPPLTEAGAGPTPQMDHAGVLQTTSRAPKGQLRTLSSRRGGNSPLDVKHLLPTRPPHCNAKSQVPRTHGGFC